MINLNPTYKEVKQLVRKDKYPSTFSGLYGFSPYMACSHACKYCDGRYEKYNVEGDYEKDIIVRQNAVELLQRELPKLREFGPICLSSGISDAYQHIEEKENLTGRCSKILAEHDLPIMIHTKSSLLLRDLENWKQVNTKGGFHLMVSLTFVDDSLRQIIEPGASSIDARLEMLNRCIREGISAGILAMPFIPFIFDDEKSLRNLFGKLKEIGVSYIMPGLLTLKAGRQKDFFLETVKQDFPDKLDKMIQLYAEESWDGSPKKKYCYKFYSITSSILKELEMPEMMPHKLYHAKFQKYQEILILLSDMRRLFKRKGIDTGRLKVAQENFLIWLKPEKQFIARRRNRLYHEIDEKIMEALRNGTFKEIIGNVKLADFFRRIFWEGMIFDYICLKLIED